MIAMLHRCVAISWCWRVLLAIYVTLMSAIYDSHVATLCCPTQCLRCMTAMLQTLCWHILACLREHTLSRPLIRTLPFFSFFHIDNIVLTCIDESPRTRSRKAADLCTTFFFSTCDRWQLCCRQCVDTSCRHCVHICYRHCVTYVNPLTPTCVNTTPATWLSCQPANAKICLYWHIHRKSSLYLPYS